IGLWLIFAPGFEAFLDDLLKAGCNVFLDAKMFDIGETVKRGVERVAERGVDGIIASPQDNPHAIRRRLGAEQMLVVTPGVRPAGAALDDHKRSGTPAQAIADGADYLVVGRPIVHSDDPAAM